MRRAAPPAAAPRIAACDACKRYMLWRGARAPDYCSERCANEELYGPGVGAPPATPTYATPEDALAAALAATRLGASVAGPREAGEPR